MKVLILANNDSGLYQFRGMLMERLLQENEVFFSVPNGAFVPCMEKLGCRFINTPIDRRGINPKTELRLADRLF